MNFFRLTNRSFMCTSNLKFTHLFVRHENSSALRKPSSKEPEIKISRETVAKLERLSLVDFGNEAGIKRLKAAIKFADQLRSLKIDDSIKPMYCVLENENLRLRSDKVTDSNYRTKILKNAVLTEEEYFVAPPGNIPL